MWLWSFMKPALPNVHTRGSVLIGVMALGSILTIAAGAGLLLASNTSRKIDATWEDHAQYYAAEGGLKRGLAWLKDGGFHGTFIITSNGIEDTVRVLADGWVISSSKPPAVSISRPLVWSYISKCRVEVNTAQPRPYPLTLHECERTSIPQTLP
jgi:hypothetical protein